MKLKVAILGSGNIGSDLLAKVLKSEHLSCSLFAGRNPASRGLARAHELGIKTSTKGIQAIEQDPDICDLVFDATSAKDHLHHWPVLDRLGKTVIDMTPSSIGKQIVPAINIQDIRFHRNVNMISCGGQASIPFAHAVSKLCKDIEYLEVVSSIASDSAGPATRINLDEYIENTEEALTTFTGCPNTKTILILNPAVPCIDMQTSVSFKLKNPDMPAIRAAISDLEESIQKYVPDYQLIVPPTLEQNRMIITVRVKGLGDFLPRYAGNLDIINCAAIATAEEYRHQLYGYEDRQCAKF